MTMDKHYSFIYEHTTNVSNDEIEIIEESKTAQGFNKVSFRCRLQEQDTINSNKRMYDETVCSSIVEQLGPRASSRNLLMEIDHPMGGSPEEMKKRATVVEIKNCGALLRNVHMKDGQIIGDIETLSGFKGPDLANLIQKDKVDIGFSLRALGGVQALPEGVLKVKTPIMPITYDIVSNPSHSKARILEFLPESDMSLLSGCDSVIAENHDITLLQDEEITLCEGNQCVRRFIDDVINEQFLNIVSRKIQFKL